MSERPSWFESFYEPEITDSDEPFYPTLETPFAEERPVPESSCDHDGKQEGPHSEQQRTKRSNETVNETIKTAPSGAGERKQDDKESKDGDQQPEKQEGKDRRVTQSAKRMKNDKDEEASHKDNTKSEIRSGLKWVTETLNGPHNEKRSVPPGISNKVPLPEDPEGKELELSSSTWGEEQGN